MFDKNKYEIIKNYIPVGTKRRPGTALGKVVGGVAHDSGNPNATDENHVTYWTRSANEEQASAHIFVDDDSIRELIPLLTGTPEVAYHVRRGLPMSKKLFGAEPNQHCGGVELCYGSKINGLEAYKRYVWVWAMICSKFNLDPMTDIEPHSILDPKRRSDPQSALKLIGKTYQQFLKDVDKELGGASIVAPVVIANGIKLGEVESIDGTTYLWSREVAKALGLGISFIGGKLSLEAENGVHAMDFRKLEDKTFVTARALEVLGAVVKYDKASNTVTVDLD